MPGLRIGRCQQADAQPGTESSRRFRVTVFPEFLSTERIMIWLKQKYYVCTTAGSPKRS